MTVAQQIAGAFALKTLSLQVVGMETTLLLQLRNLTPVGGVLDLSNTGEKKATFAVSANFEGDNGYKRTLACDHMTLEPGQSKELSLGIMMPGCIKLMLGESFDDAVEVARLPSPSGKC